MLLTCLFLMPHANYALNYTFKKSIPSKWRYFRFRDQRVLADIWTSIDSGCSAKAYIEALEMFVYNLKSNRILRKFKHFFQCLQYNLSIETKARWKIDRYKKLPTQDCQEVKNTIFPNKVLIFHLSIPDFNYKVRDLLAITQFNQFPLGTKSG